jgi:hypothetical protein
LLGGWMAKSRASTQTPSWQVVLEQALIAAAREGAKSALAQIEQPTDPPNPPPPAPF